MFFKFKLPSEILTLRYNKFISNQHACICQFAQLRSSDVTVCIIGMLCLDIRVFHVITFSIDFFPY